MAIKHIFFDWGGVLGEDNNKAAARKLSQKYSLDEDKLYKLFDEWENDYAIGEKDCAEYYQRLEKEFSIPAKELEQALCEVPAWEESLALVKELKEKGVKIYLLSNQIKTRTQAIKNDNDLNLFDEVFFSSDVGFAKPDTAIFYYVLERTGARAQECVFVDDKARNTDAAQKTGFHTIVFTDCTKVRKELLQLGVL